MKTLEDRWPNKRPLYLMLFAAGLLFGAGIAREFNSMRLNLAAMICALIFAALTMRMAYIEECRNPKVKA